MTLSEKLDSLQATVAFPTVEDYGLLGYDEPMKEQLAQLINATMARVLEEAKAGQMVYGEIASKVYGPLAELAARYQTVGLSDSETYRAVALFWAVNLCPDIYHFMRYPPREASGGKWPWPWNPPR